MMIRKGWKGGRGNKEGEGWFGKSREKNGMVRVGMVGYSKGRMAWYDMVRGWRYSMVW